jgi:hypothetical protein
MAGILIEIPLAAHAFSGRTHYVVWVGRAYIDTRIYSLLEKMHCAVCIVMSRERYLFTDHSQYTPTS